MLTPGEAVKTVWPCGNPNMSLDRIASCVPKVNAKLSKHGSTCSCHGSYNHMAMEIIAEERGLKVMHNRLTDLVSLNTTD